MIKNFFKNNAMKLSAVLTVITVSAFAVIGSGATTALWSNSASLDGATINSGNLAVAAVNAMSWTDVSKTPSVAVPNVANFIAVPGDVLDGRQSVGVALKGDNMKANFNVNLPTTTGALAATSKGVSVTYTVYHYDAPAWVTVPGSTNIPAGTPSEDILLTPSSPSVTETLAGTTTFVVKIVATFDSTTTARTRAEATAAIAAAQITLTQVRPA